MSEDRYQQRLARTLRLLSQWQGENAQLWSYTSSHRGLIVRLDSPSRQGNLHLSCQDVQFISGPTKWTNCDLQVIPKEEGGFVVRDVGAQFEVHAGGIVEAVENCKPM